MTGGKIKLDVVLEGYGSYTENEFTAFRNGFWLACHPSLKRRVNLIHPDRSLRGLFEEMLLKGDAFWPAPEDGS